MKKIIEGIHHITSIVGNAQENVDFYTKVLGLRLVKQTVNFDDPGTYHLYFGDRIGSPGTIITTFPYENASPGRIGDGQVGITTYVVPVGALEFWGNRLNKFNVTFSKSERFGEEFIVFSDVHGLKIELVEREDGNQSDWLIDNITKDLAIKGFGGVVLYSLSTNDTSTTLEKVLGLEKLGVDGDYIRFKGSSDIGNIIDLKITSIGRGVNSVGTVHHIAWRAANEQELIEWRSKVKEAGYSVTDVRERNYFKSIYFREKGGILFEIATDEPGFSIDEDVESLGENLKLPQQHERLREKLESTLIPIKR